MTRSLAGFLLALCPTLVHAAVTVTADTTAAPRFTVANAQVVCLIDCDDAGHLARETLAGQRDWLAGFGAENVRLSMDGGFAWEVVWNSWRSPGLAHNSDNPVLVDHRGFVYTGHDKQDDGLVIHLRDDDLQLEADVTWRLANGDFFIRRLVTLRDPKERGHRLLRAFGRRGAIHDSSSLVKKGEYGQPVAFTVQDGGAFLGTEWPAATNTMVPAGCGAFKLECYEDLEIPVTKDGASGAWTIAAVTPQPYVRLWFDRYLDDIRVAPLKPYLLYNSWYDLRSRDYVKEHLTGEERDVMTSANILRVARDFQTKFCGPYSIPLDAFVLDDGWDIYESDWQLRGPEFPGGLHHVDDELQKMGTTLGIWFGPTGGYSYRQRRIDWMQQHGYEVTANNMLCVGGAKYHDLLKRRNLDLIREHGVGYFKWDGVQFACNAEGHGHPIGLASRRAVLENVIDLSRTMREANPDIYLNITSGTWLSPWWLMIANQIWMQGYDYGYADVPSLTDRDAAMTYRDHVLYDDFAAQDCWFPLSNLMTHGIIKGYLERLGGEVDPLDKFTDDVVLYFARGVSMWELYVSPNLLTDGEFQAIAETVRWAKDRFAILQHTVMIGGEPAEGAAYGYAHYLGERGIIAARNPGLEKTTLTVVLEAGHGLAPSAVDLIALRTYPTIGADATRYAAGDTLRITLRPCETQIIEVMPAAECPWPLVAGMDLDFMRQDGPDLVFSASVQSLDDPFWLVNPERVSSWRADGEELSLTAKPAAGTRRYFEKYIAKTDGLMSSWGSPERFRVVGAVTTIDLNLYDAVLLQPAADVGGALPTVTIYAGPSGQVVDTTRRVKDASWAWYVVPEGPDTLLRLEIGALPDGNPWRGTIRTASVLRTDGTANPGQRIELVVTMKDRPHLPPLPPQVRRDGWDWRPLRVSAPLAIPPPPDQVTGDGSLLWTR